MKLLGPKAAVVPLDQDRLSISVAGRDLLLELWWWLLLLLLSNF